VFGSLRTGLYEPMKRLYVGENFVGMVPLGRRILAALTTGAIGISVANPTDVVKIRFQAAIESETLPNSDGSLHKDYLVLRVLKLIS
jgi:hypothetical protein